jgi:hypothetical protein
MPISALSLIQLLIAPVVMISACGLLCLAFYNRLAAIVGRTRAFNKERHDLQIKLANAEANGQETAEAREMRRRLALLDDQAGQVLRRARLVQGALFCLLTTILCMLGCSLAAGLSVVKSLAEEALWGSLGFYVVGIGAMAGGIGLAMLELRRALDTVATEWREGDMEGTSPNTEP